MTKRELLTISGAIFLSLTVGCDKQPDEAKGASNGVEEGDKPNQRPQNFPWLTANQQRPDGAVRTLRLPLDDGNAVLTVGPDNEHVARYEARLGEGLLVEGRALFDESNVDKIAEETEGLDAEHRLLMSVRWHDMSSRTGWQELGSVPDGHTEGTAGKARAYVEEVVEEHFPEQWVQWSGQAQPTDGSGFGGSGEP